MLTVDDRMEIAVGLKAGVSLTDIGSMIGRSRSVISREIRRNSAGPGRYRVAAADQAARQRRGRPQSRKIDTDAVLEARVRADLRQSRTPRQIAGRLLLEAREATVGPVNDGPDAAGSTVSHEAIYRWIYALPKGELARQGILLQSKRTARKRRKPVGERPGDFARIVGMTSIDDRPDTVADRRVPGWWEGDLIIGKHGKSAAATLVERTSRYVLILGLPEGKKATGVADILIDRLEGLPKFMRQGLTWDQGTELAEHASITVAADLPIYFAHPRSPWERPTNENTNGLIREYFPKGDTITDHQPYLDAVSLELNNRPRACLGFYTPREVFEKLLRENVASTG